MAIKPKVPLGEPLNLSKAEIRKLVEPTEQRQVLAVKRWREHTGTGANLLDAVLWNGIEHAAPPNLRLG